MTVYPTPELRQRLMHEANRRNVRDESNAWNAANVAIDILFGHFGMSKPNQNGRGETND
jgi:hypothetical protein